MVYLKRLWLQDFRNYSAQETVFKKGTNVIFGQNGQFLSKKGPKSQISDFFQGIFFAIFSTKNLVSIEKTSKILCKI